MNDYNWDAPLPADAYTKWSTRREIFVTMRDGIRLSTDVMLPEGTSGKLPTVLVRTPYDKESDSPDWCKFFLKQGYAVVVQNERGHFFSEGEFRNYLQGASTDGYDTIEWIVNQPWSNGKVGTIGCSSSAEHQWALAGNHPGHAAMIPAASGTGIGNIPGNETRGAMYRGGVPFFGVWIGWYGSSGISERVHLPPDSTEEQRVRLRQRFALTAKAGFGKKLSDSAALLHLPSQDVMREIGGPLAPFERYITWTPADARWNEVEQIGAASPVPRVPCLHVNTWHDIAAPETVRLFTYLQGLGIPNQHLIIGSGPHCIIWRDAPNELQLSDVRERLSRMSALELGSFGQDMNLADLNVGDLAVGDTRYQCVKYGWAKLFLAWLSRWLKDDQNDITAMPKVQLHVMGQGWISGDEWPLKGTQLVNYYLNRDEEPRTRIQTGTLTLEPPSSEHANSYLYDPTIPVPSMGGFGDALGAARDQRPAEARKDVLIFSTPPLENPVTVVGFVEVVLYVSSSAKDTDFFVKLVDVYPDGKAINLSDDAFRVRYREGFDKSVPMQAGHVYKITLPNMVTAARFEKGHRIQLDITSSNFPSYERNLNTGGNNYDETTPVIAENTIHYGPQTASHVVLPIFASPHDRM